MRNLIFFLVIFSLHGCSYFDEKEDVTKTWDADRLYDEARGNLDAGNYIEAVDFYQQALELDPSLFIEMNDKYTELVKYILNDINDIENPNELKLVKEYLKTIIRLKPKYEEIFSNYINIIDDKLKNYDYEITKINLKEYVSERRKKSMQNLNEKIIIGMNFNEIEFILGEPDIIKKDDNYDLWIYYTSETKFKTYFFKDYLLVKID